MCKHLFRHGLAVLLGIGMLAGTSAAAVSAEQPSPPQAGFLDTEAAVWFPDLSVARDLTMSQSPVQSFNAIDVTQTHEQALIPLPAAAWTGMAGLGALGVLGQRRLLRSLAR